MYIDRQAFFTGVRPLFGNQIKQSQASGMAAILDAWDAKMPNADPRWLAYMLATAIHETARTMMPVREAFWLSEKWREQHLRYYPYYGRGYVQLTWPANYAKAGAYIGVDLTSSPDLALRPDHAAVIMQVGMTEGWFRRDRHGRQHTLGRYFAHGIDDPVGAREIINGPEWKTIGGRKVLLATVIAGYHTTFLNALTGQQEAASHDIGGMPMMDFAPGLEAVMASPLDQGLQLAHPEELAGATSVPPREGRPDTLNLAASIVTGYVGNNTLPPESVPPLLRAVHATLMQIESGALAGLEPVAAMNGPAVVQQPVPGATYTAADAGPEPEPPLSRTGPQRKAGARRRDRRSAEPAERAT